MCVYLCDELEERVYVNWMTCGEAARLNWPRQLDPGGAGQRKCRVSNHVARQSQTTVEGLQRLGTTTPSSHTIQKSTAFQPLRRAYTVLNTFATLKSADRRFHHTPLTSHATSCLNKCKRLWTFPRTFSKMAHSSSTAAQSVCDFQRRHESTIDKSNNLQPTSASLSRSARQSALDSSSLAPLVSSSS